VPIGAIQCWPIELAGDDGRRYPLVMIGPVAVEPERQQGGLGKELVHHALDSAMELEHDGAMMLIGDPEYYGRFWGFSADLTGGWRAPGPVEQRRLLARGLAVPAVAGMLGPRATGAA
jgi:predicted N-acetyltransferase YhbS